MQKVLQKFNQDVQPCRICGLKRKLKRGVHFVLCSVLFSKPEDYMLASWLLGFLAFWLLGFAAS